jgi:hypothetical protein
MGPGTLRGSRPHRGLLRLLAMLFEVSDDAVFHSAGCNSENESTTVEEQIRPIRCLGLSIERRCPVGDLMSR